MEMAHAGSVVVWEDLSEGRCIAPTGARHAVRCLQKCQWHGRDYGNSRRIDTYQHFLRVEYSPCKISHRAVSLHYLLRELDAEPIMLLVMVNVKGVKGATYI
jgi:hypothetical protein